MGFIETDPESATFQKTIYRFTMLGASPMIEQGHLSEIFPRITPDILPSPEQVIEMRKNFESTLEYWNLIRRVLIKDRTIKLGLSTWERVVPEFDLMFRGDKQPQMNSQNSNFTKTSEAAIIGTALHEAFIIHDLALNNTGNLTREDILNSLPTYKKRLAELFAEALENGQGSSIVDVWASLQKETEFVRRMVDENSEWFGREIPQELRDPTPFLPSIEKELEVRQSSQAYEAATKLASAQAQESTPKDTLNLFETGTVINFGVTSNKTQCRTQTPLRTDKMNISQRKGKIVSAEISDLKTGKQTTDYAHQFQALLMHFLAGHAIDWINICGPNRRDGPYITKSKEELSHRIWNYTLAYNYFDMKTGETQSVKITMTPQELTEVFIPLWELYREIAVAFKPQIVKFLAGIIPHITPHYGSQPELPGFSEEASDNNTLDAPGILLDLSHLPPSKPRTIQTKCPLVGICDDSREGRCHGNLQVTSDDEGLCKRYRRKFRINLSSR